MWRRVARSRTCSSRMSLRNSLRKVFPTDEKPEPPGSAGGAARRGPPALLVSSW